jgi:hypothetical protein
MTTTTYKKLSIIVCFGFILLAHFLCYTGEILHEDDFSRIVDNSVLNKTYFQELLFNNKSDGFYRPLNHVSFGITYYLFGLNALPYALFNLFLLFGCVWLVFYILDTLSHSSVFASLITFGWLLNIKLIFPVLSWAVGRTTSMYTFFLLLALFFTLKARKSHRILWLMLTVLCTFLAMLSKESAVVGPIFVLLLVGFDIRRNQYFTIKHFLLLMITFSIVYLIYFSLRSNSQAMTMATAPSYYKISFSLKTILRHLHAFIERSLIFSALLIPAFFLRQIAKRPTVARNRTHREHVSWYWTVVCGFLLFSLAIAPMVAVPSKSNLYGFFPSIFIVGTMVTLLSYSRQWPNSRQELTRLLIMMIVLSFIVAPVGWIRGQEIKERAYIYDWSQEIYTVIRDDKPEEIEIRYNPSAITLRPVDFDYLTMTMNLRMQQPITLLINPDTESKNKWSFEILPAEESRIKGRIKLTSPIP